MGLREKLTLSRVTADISDALAYADRLSLCHNQFRPGIGPFGESQAIQIAVSRLKERHPNVYGSPQIKRTPDVLIPDDALSY